MTTTDFDAGNDVRALLLLHDALRAAVPPVARRVRAMPPGDRRAVRALARRWEALSRALRRYRRTTDDALWPLVLGAAPVLVGEVRRLARDHDQLDTDLALVTVGLDRLARLSGPEFDAVRINVAATVNRFDIYLRRHLAAQETLVLPVLRHVVDAADWAGPATELTAHAAGLTAPCAGRRVFRRPRRAVPAVTR